MEFQDNARFHFAFIIWRLVFIVGVADQGQDEAVHAGAWFDDMRDVLAFGQAVGVIGRNFRGLFVGQTGLDEIFFAVLEIAAPEVVLLFFGQFFPGGFQFIIENAHGFAGKARVL